MDRRRRSNPFSIGEGRLEEADGKELSSYTEDWSEINDSGQRLTLTRSIDSRTLEPGEYQIQIRIRDHVSGQTITPSATFTIAP